MSDKKVIDTGSEDHEETNGDNVVNLDQSETDQTATPPEEESIASIDPTDALQQELQATQDKLMRALADAENTRRRAQKDREDAGNFAISRFAKDLLDYADNFKRALDSLPEGTPDGVAEGLNAMETDILSVFERNGITKIEPLDEPFNANFHEVMFEAPMPGKPSGVIIQVIEPGYVLNGRLLRAAKVGIAKNDEDPDAGNQIDAKA